MVVKGNRQGNGVSPNHPQITPKPSVTPFALVLAPILVAGVYILKNTVVCQTPRELMIN